MLGSQAIAKAIESGEIFCYPPPKRIETGHIDVRLGSYIWRQVRHGDLVDIVEANPLDFFILETYRPGDKIQVYPGDFLLCCTEEFIGTTVPYITPMIDTRSTAARWGLTVHLSAGVGDAGFHGRWTLELKWFPVFAGKLTVGMRIASVSFYETTDNDLLYVDRYHASPADWMPDDMLPRKGNF